MSARIIVTLVCEYEGEDVQDYSDAVDDAQMYVADAADDLAADRAAVRVLEVTVTG